MRRQKELSKEQFFKSDGKKELPNPKADENNTDNMKKSPYK